MKIISMSEKWSSIGGPWARKEEDQGFPPFRRMNIKIKMKSRREWVGMMVMLKVVLCQKIIFLNNKSLL